MITYTVTFDGKEISIKGDGDSYMGEAGVSILTVESWPEEWADFSKYVIFRLPDGTLLEPASFGEEFTISGPLLADSGKLQVSFAGYKDGVEIIRSGIATIPISNTLKDGGTTTSWNSVVSDCVAMTEDFKNATATSETLAEGESATVSLTDGASGKEFAFGIPKGDKGEKGDTGDAATIAVGKVTTLDAGESVTIENNGTSAAAVFDFGIPKGDTGEVSATDLATAISGHNTSDTAHQNLLAIPFTNLVSNGDFSAGTVGWTAYSATNSVSNKIMSNTASGANTYGIFYTVTANRFSANAGDRIYARIRWRLTNDRGVNLYAKIASSTPSAQADIIPSLGAPAQDQWYERSGIIEFPATSTSIGFYVYHYYANAADATGGVLEIDGNYGITVINLTTIETLTGIAPSKAAVDKICATWWNGTKQVSLFDFLIAEIIALRA